MVLYVLVAKGPKTGPPALAVFSDKQLAERAAADPYYVLGWCISSDLEVARAELAGTFESGQLFYAAHKFVGHKPEQEEVYSFLSLHSAWDEAEEAAGELGAVNELVLDEHTD